jgi:hypothetical protein
MRLLAALLACSRLGGLASADTVMLIGLSGDNSRIVMQGSEEPPPPPPPANATQPELLQAFGLGFVSGECVNAPDPTTRAQLRSRGVSLYGLGGSALAGEGEGEGEGEGFSPVASVMYECVSDTRIRISIFSAPNCINSIPYADRDVPPAATAESSDWDGTLDTEVWQNTVTFTLGGKTYNRQEKLSTLRGCPSIDAVGWVFIGLAVFVVVMGVGAMIGYEMGHKRAVKVAAAASGEPGSGEPGATGAAPAAAAPAVAAGSIQAPLLPPPVTASALAGVAGVGVAGLNDSVSSSGAE